MWIEFLYLPFGSKKPKKMTDDISYLELKWIWKMEEKALERRNK